MRVGTGTGGNTTARTGPRVRTAVLTAIAAVAALGLLAGCTRDPDVEVSPIPSGPLRLSDVELVRTDDCETLVDDAQQRAEDARREMERLEDLASAGGSDGSGFAEVGGELPATTITPSAADAAAPSAAAGEQRTASESQAGAADDDTGTTTADGTVVAGTNNQERGVDEGDLVATDGSRLVTLTSDGVLRVVVLDDSPAVDGVLPLLPSGTAQSGLLGQQGQLLLRDDEVVAVVGTWDSGSPVTNVVRVDLADPRAPRVVEQARVAGEPVATRMVDGRIRIVLRPTIGGPVVEPMPLPEPTVTIPPTTVPDPTVPATTVPATTVPPTTMPPTTMPATTVPSTSTPERSTTTVPGTTTRRSTTTTIADPTKRSEVSAEAARLLPQRLTAAGASEPLGGCEDVFSTPTTAGSSPAFVGDGTIGAATDMAYPVASSVTVLSVGETLGDLAPVTVEGGAEAVYAATGALYTTSTTWDSAGPVTAVHRFDLTADGPATYTGSGLVPGQLLNQYSLSDRDGALRIVTTAQTSAVPGGGNEDVDPEIGRAVDGGAGDNGSGVAVDIAPTTSAGRITVLRPDGSGTLREVGHLDDLGVGEQVKSVRFIEDRAYVVTFRRTDPLFAVDLSDDTAPRLLGELKIPGFSEYLHPIGDQRLLGVGAEADPQSGRVTGFKVSLFDVSDPTAPEELDAYVEPGAVSGVGGDPHSFTWDPVRRQAVVPVATSGGSDCPADASCAMPVEPMPMPVDDVPSTTLACPPGADCATTSGQGAGAYEQWSGVEVLGVEGDSLVLRGRLAHEVAPASFPQILRSVVVDSDLWTVSDVAVGRTDARRPTSVDLLRF